MAAFGGTIKHLTRKGADVALRGVFSGVCCLSPLWNTQLRFLLASGHFVNLKQPTTFSEKLSWLKLHSYAHDPLVRQCADKLAVRSYVEQCGLGHLLNELYTVYERPEQIEWDRLPDAFALKWNFGSGYNVLCPDKSSFDRSAALRKLKRWGRQAFWTFFGELQYKNVPKRILCERFLDAPPGEELLDYKFYCFHGQPKAVLVIARPEEGDKAAVFMSPDWQLLSDVPARYRASLSPDVPAALAEMLEAARTLSAPFPFVRVDFYEWHGKAVFGEMTFTPAAGIFPSECLLEGRPMGEFLHLDEN